LRFLLDNNLSPHIARGLHALSQGQHQSIEVRHLRDLYPGPTPDTIWLAGLKTHGDGQWFVVSIDKFRKQARAERLAIQHAGHVVYVLDPSWSSAGYWPQAANLPLWWPTLLVHASVTSGGVYRVPWKRGTAGKLTAI
jgi:PIN like domain